MQTTIVLIFIGCLLAELVAAPLYFSNLSKLFAYMQKNHRDQWIALGSPTLFMNNSISSSSNVIQYLMKKKYFQVQDQILIGIAGKTRALFFVSFSLGAILILAGFSRMLF